MARTKLNMDLQDVSSGFSMLVYGDNATGKTAFCGDMLQTELKDGEVRFINVRGEDGTLTLKGLGLGDRGETVETYDDFIACLLEYSKLNLSGLAVDSLRALNRWVSMKVCKADRMPIIDRSSPNDEWGALHREMANLAMLMRRSAKYVIATCPADRSMNQVSNTMRITPDLPGREAAGSAGWFDFVGYLTADPMGPEKVKRVLTFVPNSQLVVRQRLPAGKALETDFILPTGAGGWAMVKGEIIKRVAQTPHCLPTNPF